MSFGSGMFNMDTPWLYIYTSHKLSQQQRHTLQLTSELTASKWLTIRNLILEAFYRDRGREREARLELYTPSVIYLQVRPEKATASKSSEYHNLVFGLVSHQLPLQAGGWGTVGKRNVKASCSLSSLWTASLRGDVSLEASKFSHTLQMTSSYGKHNASLMAALNTVDKVGGDAGLCLWNGHFFAYYKMKLFAYVLVFNISKLRI